MSSDNQTAMGRQSRNMQKLERTVSARKLELGKKKAVEVISYFLQQEASMDTKIFSYDDLFDLTQEEGFLKYQKEIHERHRRKEELAIEMLVQGLIQLRGLDDLLTTICGYLWQTRALVAHANENVKQAAHDALARYDGEITQMTGKDKEGTRWTIQFNPAHPESVTLKKSRKDKGAGRSKA